MTKVGYQEISVGDRSGMAAAGAAAIERGAIERGAIERGKTDGGGSRPPGTSPKGTLPESDAGAATCALSADGRRVTVRGGDGQVLDLAIEAWAEVLVALDQALTTARMRSDPGATPRFGPRPGRFGADWSDQELATLAKGHKGGMSVAALALSHQRTTGAVEQQLVRLGLIAMRDRQYSGSRSSFGEP